MSHSSTYLEDAQFEIRVAGRFRMGKKIGSGSFGEIFLALDLQTGKEVAVKFESIKVRRPQLIEEAKLLKDFVGEVGFPQFVWFGKEGEYYIMVIELLGPSLEDLFVYCGKKLSLKTVLLIGEQLVQRIETFQMKGFIHRDLKPENILIGLEENSSTLYLIDFGLAKRWKNPATGEHIPFKDKKSLTGTARYASANTHLGIEQSRRDDLEGAGYVLLYLLKGELPWQGLRARNKDDKYRKIKECKVNTPVEMLCQGYPEEMAHFMNYTRQLKFEEAPNYAYLKRLFRELYIKCGFEHDFIFDWTIQRYRVDRPSSLEEEKQKTSTYQESMKNQQASIEDQNMDGQNKGEWDQNAFQVLQNEEEQRIKSQQLKNNNTNNNNDKSLKNKQSKKDNNKKNDEKDGKKKKDCTIF